MRIDSHQHFWMYTPESQPWISEDMQVIRRDFLPQDLKIEIDREGFDGTVAIQAPQSLDETRFLLRLANENAFIKGVVGWVDLQSPDVESQIVEFADDPKFVGVRHIAQSESDDFLLGKAFQRGVALLEDFGLTYDILIYARQMPAAIELVRRFPRQRFVLDHIGKPEIKAARIAPWDDQIRELAKHANVWCKVSGIVTEADWRGFDPSDLRPYLDVVFDSFAPRRLMIGSDWPVCLVAASYSQAIEVVAEYVAALPESDQKAVLGGSATGFYCLN
jgi:L-fuconolactonase